MKLTAEMFIRCDPNTVWRLSQTPEQHVRWDARFTEITYLPKENPDAAQRFRYATRIGFGRMIEGWGETVGEKDGRGSALRFGSDDPKSLIREGGGYWAYKPEPGGTRFVTVYDYDVRYGWLGRAIDGALFRPLMIGATRWSFDRLRLWIERGIEPELALRLWLTKGIARVALGLVWVLEGLVPKILFVGPGEIALVRKSGFFVGTPEATLVALGIAEVLAGLWLISGRAERAAVLAASVVMLALSGVAAATDPTLLVDPAGGLYKDLCLLACAAVVWMLAPITPKAARAKPRGGGSL